MRASPSHRVQAANKSHSNPFPVFSCTYMCCDCFPCAAKSFGLRKVDDSLPVKGVCANYADLGFRTEAMDARLPQSICNQLP